MSCLFHFYLEIELIIHSKPLKLCIFCGDIISHYICNLNYNQTPSNLNANDTRNIGKKRVVVSIGKTF